MKPVIFMDWDGTIADSMKLCIEEVRYALVHMGLPDRPDRELMQCNGPTNVESIALMNVPKERGDEYLALREKAELELLSQYQRIFPGMKEMLHRVQSCARLAIVSNGNAAYLDASMDFLGVKECFERAQGYRDGHTKAENLAMLLEELHPAKAVMVGDRAGDMLAGKANHLPTIAACYGYGSPEEWAMADEQAYSVAQLEQMLLRLAEA